MISTMNPLLGVVVWPLAGRCYLDVYDVITRDFKF